MKGAQSQAQRRMPAPTSLEHRTGGTRPSASFRRGRRLSCRDVNVSTAASMPQERQHRRGRKQVLAMIGPSVVAVNFLRCLNRMNDTIPGTRVTGSIKLDDLTFSQEPGCLRLRAGRHVFQKPNPFPNPLRQCCLRAANSRTRVASDLDDIVCTSLQRADYGRSEGPAQPSGTVCRRSAARLCIARAIAIQPEVILMDDRARA